MPTGVSITLDDAQVARTPRRQSDGPQPVASLTGSRDLKQRSAHLLPLLIDPKHLYFREIRRVAPAH